MTNKGSSFPSSTFSTQKVDQFKQILQGEEQASLPQSGGLPTAEELQGELDAAQLEIKTLKDKLFVLEKESRESQLRSLADLENLRRRLEKDKDELVRYENEALLKELLIAVDNLERSLAHIGPSSTTGALVDGITLILKGLVDTLRRFGVTEIDTQEKLFDPHFHEAVGQQEVDNLAPDTIIDVVQKGYLYRDRLLRAARVIVSQ